MRAISAKWNGQLTGGSPYVLLTNMQLTEYVCS